MTRDSPTEEAGSVAAPASNTKESRAFLQVARKDLTEEDLTAPGVRRFLIAEIERLDEECAQLRTTKEQCNRQQVEIAELKATLRSSRAYEIMSFVCLSVGSTGIGAAISYLSLDNPAPLGWVVLVGSGVLFIAGIVARVMK